MAVLPKEAEQAEQAPAQQETKNERRDLGPGSLSGNLTADPELRYTPTGRAVCKLRIAFTPRTQNPDTGEWKDGRTQFFDVTAWGQLAENCAEHLAKGQRIVADGQWESRAWEDKEGNTQETIGLVARDLGPSMLFAGARVIKSQRRPG